MPKTVDETVGPEFSSQSLQKARDQSLEVILQTARWVRPGHTEKEARLKIAEIQKALGAPKSWHPPQIRFGPNTLMPFNAKGVENPILQATDIFFFDIGPIFEGHEGDVGRSFTVGADPEMKRCCEDVEKIWFEVYTHWKERGVSGSALYDFADQRARDRGWQLSLRGASGHRIADFPHAARARGTIRDFSRAPAPDRWILEIQIRHPDRPFGAFYEDLLT